MKSIILFGDSVFFGVGASSRGKGCGKLLKKLIDAPVIIKSHNLDTSRDGLIRLDKDVLRHNDVLFVIVMFGNNDCRLDKQNNPNVPLQEYKANLRIMAEKIRSVSKVPLIANLQPISSEGFFKLFPGMEGLSNAYPRPDAWQKKYSDMCHEVSNEERITLVDIRTPLEKNFNSIIAEDGLHPNDNGHKIIAFEIKNILKTKITNL